MSQTARIRTTGMHCQSCSMLIQMNLADLEGVEDVASEYATGMTTVTYDENVVGTDELLQEIRKAGYGAELE